MASISDVSVSSDSDDDANYVPTGEVARSESSGGEHLSEDEHPNGQPKLATNKSFTKQKGETKKDAIREIDSKELKVDPKKHADDVWKSFLNDVESTSATKPNATASHMYLHSYVPTGEVARSESSGGEHLSEDEHPNGQPKLATNKSFTKQKGETKKDAIREIDSKELKVDPKKHADDVWKSFLNDVESTSATKPNATASHMYLHSYVPTGEVARSESSGGEHLSEDEHPNGQPKLATNKSFTKQKGETKKDAIREIDSKELKVDPKKHADDVWKSFLNDVESTSATKPNATASQDVDKTQPAVATVPGKDECKDSKVPVENVFEFAGETITVVNDSNQGCHNCSLSNVNTTASVGSLEAEKSVGQSKKKRLAMCQVVLKSVVDRVEKEEKNTQRKQKCKETAEERKMKASTVKLQTLLLRHTELLRRDILKKRTVMEKEIKVEIQAEVQAEVKKREALTAAIPPQAMTVQPTPVVQQQKVVKVVKASPKPVPKVVPAPKVVKTPPPPKIVQKKAVKLPEKEVKEEKITKPPPKKRKSQSSESDSVETNARPAKRQKAVSITKPMDHKGLDQRKLYCICKKPCDSKRMPVVEPPDMDTMAMVVDIPHQNGISDLKPEDAITRWNFSAPEPESLKGFLNIRTLACQKLKEEHSDKKYAMYEERATSIKNLLQETLGYREKIKKFLDQKAYLFKTPLDELPCHPDFLRDYASSKTGIATNEDIESLEVLTEVNAAKKTNLSPCGEFKQRELKAGDAVFVKKTSVLDVFVPGTVLSVGGDVRLDDGKSGSSKLYTTKQLAYREPCDVVIPLGTPIIGCRENMLKQIYVMFPNRNNLCWIDASMALLVHNRTLIESEINGPSLVKNIINTYYNSICILNNHGTSKPQVERLKDARNLLEYTQELAVKYLKPILKFESGTPDSAFCSLLNLTKENRSVTNIFELEYTMVQMCQQCKAYQAKKHKKTIVTLPKVEDFQPSAPVSLYQCPVCKALNQRMTLSFRNLPQCLLFHFEGGAGKGNLECRNFIVGGRTYELTGVMMYEKKQFKLNHFVTFIRDPVYNKWLDCNDIGVSIRGFNETSPFIYLPDVYILMFEALDRKGTVPNCSLAKDQEEELSNESVDIPIIDLEDEEEEDKTETSIKEDKEFKENKTSENVDAIEEQIQSDYPSNNLNASDPFDVTLFARENKAKSLLQNKNRSDNQTFLVKEKNSTETNVALQEKSLDSSSIETSESVKPSQTAGVIRKKKARGNDLSVDLNMSNNKSNMPFAAEETNSCLKKRKIRHKECFICASVNSPKVDIKLKKKKIPTQKF